MPLLLPPVAIRVAAGASRELQRRPVDRPETPSKTLGALENPFSLAGLNDAALGARHVSCPFVLTVSQGHSAAGELNQPPPRGLAARATRPRFVITEIRPPPSRPSSS